eukprot:gene3357-biopygen7405
MAGMRSGTHHSCVIKDWRSWLSRSRPSATRLLSYLVLIFDKKDDGSSDTGLRLVGEAKERPRSSGRGSRCAAKREPMPRKAGAAADAWARARRLCVGSPPRVTAAQPKRPKVGRAPRSLPLPQPHTGKRPLPRLARPVTRRESEVGIEAEVEPRLDPGEAAPGLIRDGSKTTVLDDGYNDSADPGSCIPGGFPIVQACKVPAQPKCVGILSLAKVNDSDSVAGRN